MHVPAAAASGAIAQTWESRTSKPATENTSVTLTIATDHSVKLPYVAAASATGPPKEASVTSNTQRSVLRRDIQSRDHALISMASVKRTPQGPCK